MATLLKNKNVRQRKIILIFDRNLNPVKEFDLSDKNTIRNERIG